MTTGTQIVNEAKKHIGAHEHPLGSNSGPFVEACQRATFLAGTGWPWCAAFEDYVCRQAGAPLAYNGAGAHDQADHHKPWVDAAHVEPGMMVDYNIGSGHTGIVVNVDHHTGTVTSIDGNWSDSVVEHALPLASVRAFWRVPGVNYGTGPALVKPRRLPGFVVATSESGHRKVVFRAEKKRGLIKWLGAHNLARLFPNGITVTRAKR